MAEGKKGRKVGRNAVACNAYRLSEKREKSKARRLLKHLRRQPGDELATKAFAALPEHIKKKAKSAQRSVEEQGAALSNALSV